MKVTWSREDCNVWIFKLVESILESGIILKIGVKKVNLPKKLSKNIVISCRLLGGWNSYVLASWRNKVAFVVHKVKVYNRRKDIDLKCWFSRLILFYLIWLTQYDLSNYDFFLFVPVLYWSRLKNYQGKPHCSYGRFQVYINAEFHGT